MAALGAESVARPARPRRIRGSARRPASRLRTSETTWLLLLLALTVGLGALVVNSSPAMAPVATLVVPILLGGLLLSLRALLVVVGLAGTFAAAGVLVQGPAPVRLVGAGVVVTVAVISVAGARVRTRLGVQGMRGEAMLIDLRDRLSAQGALPPLPRQWRAACVLRSAYGAAFAGDFVVAAKTCTGQRLEVVLVDVSGKGLAAGTRALMLSGAFGGLLGALPAGSFLDAANVYLLRQGWAEGFATAIHLDLDLVAGRFEVRTAGHPPAVQFHAGSGRWEVHHTEGPVLGVLENAEFGSKQGTVAPGDALLLYTDGLVETPQRDLTLGIDKLVGEGERLVTRGFREGARHLLDRLESDNDDRALLMLHRGGR